MTTRGIKGLKRQNPEMLKGAEDFGILPASSAFP